MFLSGLVISLLLFRFLLRNGKTALKTTVVCSTTMCLGLAVYALLLGELFMAAVALAAFVIASVYANMAWPRISFTATNLSVAITAVRDNMGLFVAAMVVAAVGLAWQLIAVTGGLSKHRTSGKWALAYSIFSYYWTHQVLCNIVSVTTAGIVGRWLVVGTRTPDHNRGLLGTLARSSTYSFGSVCMGSLYFGIVEILGGLGSFLYSKRVPIVPRLLDRMLRKMNGVVGEVNGWAFAYIGLYGYSYTSAARNVMMLFHNKGWEDIVRHHLAGNIMFMASMTIGLVTGLAGLFLGSFKYQLMLNCGFSNPDSDGFFVGFLVGFLVSSIMLSVLTATINTVIVCLAESPAEFKSKHPALSERLEAAWLNGEDTRAEM